MYDAFVVKDNNNYMLECSHIGYGDNNNGFKEVPPNTKSKISIQYVAENDITSISIEFTHAGTLKDIPVTE